MNELKEFNININGENHKAILICAYNLSGNDYCIYGIKNQNNDYDIYNGKIVNNKIVEIEDKEKLLADKITTLFIKEMEGMEN